MTRSGRDLILPRTHFGLSSVGQQPGILLLFLHGHLFVAPMRFAHDIVALLPNDDIAVLAASLYPSLDFESVGQLQKGLNGRL